MDYSHNRAVKSRRLDSVISREWVFLGARYYRSLSHHGELAGQIDT